MRYYMKDVPFCGNVEKVQDWKAGTHLKLETRKGTKAKVKLRCLVNVYLKFLSSNGATAANKFDANNQ